VVFSCERQWRRFLWLFKQPILCRVLCKQGHLEKQQGLVVDSCNCEGDPIARQCSRVHHQSRSPLGNAAWPVPSQHPPGEDRFRNHKESSERYFPNNRKRLCLGHRRERYHLLDVEDLHHSNRPHRSLVLCVHFMLFQLLEKCPPLRHQRVTLLLPGLGLPQAIAYPLWQ
jgi:hypothetical protein